MMTVPRSDEGVRGVAVELRNFQLAYRSTDKGSHPLFEDLNLSIQLSEIVAILGPSGCGKTSLLKAIAGLLSSSEVISQGDIFFNGQPQSVILPRLKIGFVFQKSYLFPWQTARQNIGLSRRLQPDRWQHAETKDQIDQFLASAGLENDGGKYPGELSGGMQQRVALIREFLKTPDLMLMDEPFGQLDRSNRNQMGAEVLRLWERCKPTVLIVTHDPEDGVFLADRVFVFHGKNNQLTECPVPLPRPRQQNIRRSPEFQGIVERILDLIAE